MEKPKTEYPLSEDRETDQVLSKRRSGMVGLVQGFCQRKEAAISIPSWHLFFSGFQLFHLLDSSCVLEFRWEDSKAEI